MEKETVDWLDAWAVKQGFNSWRHYAKSQESGAYALLVKAYLNNMVELAEFIAKQKQEKDQR